MTTAVRPVLRGTPGKRHQLRKLRGEPSPLTDAAPVVAHIRHLTDELGLSCAAIGEASDIHDSFVRALRRGDRGTRCVQRWVAAAILRVDGRPHPAQVKVLGHGFRRRSEALAVAGYSHTYQARRLDVRRATDIIRITRQTTIPGRRHWQMVDLFRELSHRPGPSSRATTWARKKGYVGPFAWEDIDDPAAVPEPVDYDLAADQCLGEDAAFMLSAAGGNQTMPAVIARLKVPGRNADAKASTVWQAVRRYRLKTFTADDLHALRQAAHDGAYGEDLAARYLLTPGQITGLLAGTLREDLPRLPLQGSRAPIRAHLMH